MRLRLLFAAILCNTGFSDLDLQRWSRSHSNGLILVVSDGMPYSQKSAESVAEEAKKRNLALLILSDRTGPKQQSRCDSLVQSNVLIGKGALRHFPTLFFVKNHALQKHIIPGIQTQSELSSSLDEIFSR
jgi:hypothetical protein